MSRARNPRPLVDDLATIVRMMRNDIRNIVNNWEKGDLAEAVNWAAGSVPEATRVLRRFDRAKAKEAKHATRAGQSPRVRRVSRPAVR